MRRESGDGLDVVVVVSLRVVSVSSRDDVSIVSVVSNVSVVSLVSVESMIGEKF